MRRELYWCILFVSLMFLSASCIKDSFDDSLYVDTKNRICFGMNDAYIDVNAATKATAVTSLDEFYVSAVVGSAGSESSAWASTLFTKVSGSSPAVYSGNKYWPASNPSYKFYASNMSLSFASAGTTVSASNTTDVVCAYLSNPSYKDLNTLVFEHVFARLGNFTVSSEGGYTLSNIVINIIPKVSGTYNLRTKEWTSTSVGSSVVLASSIGSSNHDLFLVPGTYRITASWRASLGTYSEDFSGKYVDVELPAGLISNITLSLTGDGSKIKFSVAMSDWSSIDIAKMPATTPPPLFRVSSSKLVEFSPGHLQAHICERNTNLTDVYNGFLGRADKWRFADPEWDYSTSPELTVNSWTSHYSYCGNTAQVSTYGLCYINSASNAIYTGVNPTSLKVEYGSIPELIRDCGDGWELLTNSEWTYLCNTRSTGITVNGVNNARYTMARIRSDVDGGVLGLILFPEGYSGGTPSGVTWGTVNSPSNYSTQCTASGWDALYEAGCVFLVALGDRNSSSIKYGQNDPNYTLSAYWAKNASGNNSYAYRLIFSSYNTCSLNINTTSVGSACGIRLVRVYN